MSFLENTLNKRRLILIFDILDRPEHIFVEVLYKCLNKALWSNSFPQPRIIVQIVTFASDNAQTECKVVLLEINELNQRVFDVLCDVQDFVQGEILIFSQRADRPNHELLVEVP